MTLRLIRIPAAFVFGTMLLAGSAPAQTRVAAPESPYGGTTVEEIVARVNDQIITRSDYDRAMKELDEESRQRGALMQEISASHKDLLRNLIDQQLWLAKGKELNITGETELIGKLDEIRKQSHLETLEDLEKAAKEQGISFEDYKASIRNRIITQDVMRQAIGRRIQFTPGEAQRYFEQHKQEYVQPESVSLAEILISTGTPTPSVTGPGAVEPDDPQKVAAAKAKADDIEAKLSAGGDFSQLAKSFSDGPTSAAGGDLGQYKRGELAKIFEDKTFALKTGQFTEPIRTKQGYVIMKVVSHVKGGVPEYKDVMAKVEDDFYMSRMEPAIREYLTTLRNETAIFIKPGYEDSAATQNEKTPTISFSAYTPPAPKKKQKVERTRFRENTRSFRQKSSQPTTTAETPTKTSKKQDSNAVEAQMKPGKKEKIRYGKAPTKTLPSAPEAKPEDAGAAPKETASTVDEPVNPLENTEKPTQKTRYSSRAKVAKQAKVKGPKIDPLAPPAPDAAEAADRQTQAAPLGLGGDTSTKKKKKKTTTTGEKTRLTDKKKTESQPQSDQAPAPAPTSQPQQ
jgi:peptidyl-prolyl cis-trans isomerase SurA